MEKEGPLAAFILALIGGIYSMCLGAVIIFVVVFRVWEIGEIGEELTKGFVIGYLFLALYFLVLGLWILTASFWIKKEQNLRKGFLTSLILGIISLNTLAITAGALGMDKLSKMNQGKIVIQKVKITEKPEEQRLKPSVKEAKLENKLSILKKQVKIKK